MKKKEILKIGSLTVVLAAVLMGQKASALTLTEYMTEVQRESLGYKASSEQASAAGLKEREADLFFSPRWFVDARVGHDGKEPFASTISYKRLYLQNYSLGLSQEFKFGLQTKLSYALDRTEVEGATLPAGVPNSFWRATPTLELSLPLWANGFGRTTEANAEITRQQNRAEKLGANAQNTAFLVEAEAAYWRLASAREVVNVQTQALQQAQSILDYVSRKAKMNLGENSDILQAKALVEARAFQLKQAQNQEKAVQRVLNTFLNRKADSVIGSLEPLNYGSLQKVEVPTVKSGDRYDVQAAAAQALITQSAAQLVAERNKPKVDLYGSYSLDGTEPDLDKAMAEAGTIYRDSAFVGVRVSVPFNMGALGDAKAGALKAQRAAELSYEHKKFSQEQDWENLVQQLAEAKESLRLATNIVTAQKLKLDNERIRLRQGRTTTYQVLLFEQDFTQSEVARVQAAALLLGLQAQIKLYQTSSEGGI